ncbi:hypothetical protein ABZQ24_05445 [Pseudomonas aeruginosa]|uniref:hypothetical protein n=1 Tax=Pseudomonas aeruginosa TaxID=287 RepID=UPI0019131D3A|nr:hypothetical protein [Pseudomonas aeruginosa]MBW0950719.1 hypothetical protein [Pseudomonas aeruginosa]HBN9568131.1 hypothetical protein [Pseudomonas aeruginosa]HBO3382708.1 hypothetical protein [Pseudomonas aeruginosa]HBO3669310.1 hypothetical protein [Pseudomonas aeruginosa]HCF7758373.1 hypothetical protein [Pseudomonas aeruginosa]
MTNELTDVRCPCGDEFPADSYDAGFIAGSGMCQNCDAAMPPKDIPAPVEQAGGDERAAFEAAYQTEHAGFMGPLKLERRVDGEYKSEHVGSAWRMWQARAALAQPSPVRSSLLINGYQLRDALEFIAPDGTAEQLESEARIEWRQQDADFLEAGLYAWCAEYPEEGCVLLDDEPATAQPSPASDLDPLNLAPHAEAFNEAPAEALKPEQAEAERPEVVATMYTHHDDVDFREFVVVGNCDKGCEGFYGPEKLMTVAQHERIAASRWERAMDLMGEHVARISDKLTAERDAALAEVERLTSVCASLDSEKREMEHKRIGIIAMRDAALARVAELEKQEPVAHLRASDLERLNQPGIAGSAGSLWNGPREGFVPLYAAPVAQAGHSVPEGWMLVECGIWTQEQVDEMQKTVARFRNSEFVDDRALAMAVADAGQCKAPEISLAELLATAPAQGGDQ